MKSIKENTINELIINKSRFITELIKINSIDDISKNLNEIKTKYKGATHYCYGYVIDNNKKFSDDKEPGGTAGLPILSVLENNDLNNILCVVIRYFGGIKLGAGGLVRAYTKAVTTGLKNSCIINLEKGFKIEIQFSYDKAKIVDSILKDKNILNKSFDEIIIYEFVVNYKEIDNIKNALESSIIKFIQKENMLIEI